MDKQISVRQLRPGMYIQKLHGSFLDRLLWQSAFLLADQDEVQAIVDSGLRMVWIDTDKGLDVPAVETPNLAPVVAKAPATPDAECAPCSIEDELDRAAKICRASKQFVASMFNEARMGKAVEVGQALEMVEEISASVQRNPAALISLARIKNSDDHTYLHSVAVCGLMVALARQLGFDEAQTRDAGLAGLLHDIGKMAIPPEVLNKPGKLSKEEFKLVMTHPEQGVAMLKEGEDASPVVLDVCLHHHERADGYGYPHGLKGDEIGVFARMGAVCDVYDAVTSNRPREAGWDPAESLRKMASWAEDAYDPAIFQAFVKSIGIYPTGSLLKLKSGKLCVVVEQSKSSLLRPRVKYFFSTRSNTYIKPTMLDLSQRGCAEEIEGPEPADKWNIKDIDKLWMGNFLM